MKLKEKILKLKMQGLTHKEITEQLNCSLGVVSYHCRNHQELNQQKLGKYHEIEESVKEFLIFMFCECGTSLKEAGEVLDLEEDVIASFYQNVVKGINKRLKYPNCSSYSAVKRRRKRLKLLGVLLLGGKCMRCGFCDDIHSLEFHHINKDNKDFSLSEKMNASWDTWKKELLKCKILCSNCHRTEHSSESDVFNQALKMFQDLKKDGSSGET